MVWIREAEQKGRTQAILRDIARQTSERNWQMFEGEGNATSERLAEFLQAYTDPVQGIITDLEGAGYHVEGGDPGFYHHSFAGENKEDLSKFSLTETVDSHGFGSTGYTKRERRIFGMEWMIGRGDELLGRIGIYPVINEYTHYAGVQYRATGELSDQSPFKREYGFQFDDKSYGHPLSRALKGEVSQWIQSGQSLQTVEA